MSTDVSVLVLNYNGREHVLRCLDACSRLDAQGLNLEVVCIDNGSSDGSLEAVSRRFAGVRLIANPRNLGFARAYNEAVAAVEGEWVALINNDAVPDPSWITAAIDAANRHHAVCIGSRILKDGGKRNDFVGSSMNFYGHGFHLNFDEPAGAPGEEQPMLFASGGAMLIKRATFLEAGGFDEDYFAYFEDVDLGWRLNILGFDVVYAPESFVLHVHAATSRRIPAYKKLAWLERNGLRSVIKNYDDQRLARILPAALALVAERACLHSAIDPNAFFFEELPRRTATTVLPPKKSKRARAREILRERGAVAGSGYILGRALNRASRPRFSGDWDPMDRRGFSSLAAIDAVVWDTGGLRARRDRVQRARRRPDDVVVKLFRDTFRPSFPEPELRVVQDALVDALGIRELL